MGKVVGSRPAATSTRTASPLPRIRAVKPSAIRKPPAAAAAGLAPAPAAGMQQHTADGARKYLTAGERDGFLREADRGDRRVRTLCMTLAYGGCRLSEALALTVDRVDFAAGVLVFESIKKRRDGIYRTVPVPPALLKTLNMVHGIRELQGQRGKGRGVRLWPWSRMTGWRAVHAVMRAVGLYGAQSSPKRLRHGFGVSAGVSLNMVQKWLGQAQLSTTAIYANAVGAECSSSFWSSKIERRAKSVASAYRAWRF